MNPLRLVVPLEDPWQDLLDAVLRDRGHPTTRDVARMAPKVMELSRAYNAGVVGGASGPDAGKRLPLEARIAFSFARDVPKGAAAVRELVATKALTMPQDRPLRIVDLGAGLGAMTWGIVRALEAAGASGSVEVLLVDEDEAALSAAKAIAAKIEASFGARALRVSVRTRTSLIHEGMSLPQADLVVLGQVLSELDVGVEPEARVLRHATILAELLRTVVAPHGALVVVEPALRDRSRHLQAVRDRLTTRENVALFAPCLHAKPCPSLAAEGDWCHDDLRVDLPAWLVPLARASGLRFQGLTFSYLVVRPTPETTSLAAMLPERDPSRVHLRVVSNVIRSKGKTEIFACTEGGERLRLRRLDRDAEGASAAWDELSRGDVVALSSEPGKESFDPDGTFDPPFDERGRTSKHLRVDVWPFRN